MLTYIEPEPDGLDGVLIIEAETLLEQYALNKWLHDHPSLPNKMIIKTDRGDAPMGVS